MRSWKSLFDKKTIQDGVAYCSMGKAKHLVEENDGYSLTIRGDRNYNVGIHLDYDDRIQRLSCNCDEGKAGKYCLHMAAALHYTEDFLDEKLYLGNALEKEQDEIEAMESAPAAPAKQKGREKAKSPGTKSQLLRKTYGDSIKELDILQAAEEKDRSLALAEEGRSGATRAAEPYRYFQVEKFRKDLRISRAVLLKAEQLLSRQQYSIGVTLGFFELGGYGYYSFSSNRRSTDNVNLARVELEDASGKVLATQYYDPQGPVQSRCADWNCNPKSLPQSPVGHELCVHEVAALLVAEQYFSTNAVGDMTSKNALSLFDTLGTAVPAEAATPARRGSLTLEPQIRLDSYSNWSLLFKAGENRLYKVQKLQEFCEDVALGKPRAFGRSTTIQLSEDAFDEEGKKWLSFIRNAIHVLAMFSDPRDEEKGTVHYYDPFEGWKPVSDRLPLFGEILDRLFDTAGDTPISFENTAPESREKRMVSMREADYRPTLLLSPYYSKNSKILDGVELTGTLPRLLHGSTASYFLDGDSFKRIPRETVRLLDPLFRSAGESGKVQIVVGRQRLPEFWRKVLPHLQEVADIEKTGNDVIESYLPSEPAFVSYLDVQDGIVLCRPEVYYDSLRHTPFDVYAWNRAEKAPEPYRDRPAEEHLIRFLERYLPEHDEELGLFLSVTGEDALFEFLGHGLGELIEFCEVRASERFRALKIRRRMPIKVGVSLESGIMDLTLTSEDLSPDELLEVLRSYRRKAKYVRLKNGDFLQLEDNEAVQQMDELISTLHLAPKSLVQEKMQIPAFRALYLDRMLESMQDVYSNRDRHFKSLIKEFKTVSDADFAVPENLKATLRKYQLTGYRWLRTLDTYGFGGILADDMGLGKTIQTIAVLLASKNEEGEGTSIIVCPASLVYNWQDELRRFAPDLRVLPVVGSGAERRALIATAGDWDVLVTSYDYLKRDIAEYQGFAFRYAVVDEAQYIKNQTTAAAKSVKLLTAKTHFALTGTPIENKLSDLWSIFDFLMPGFLYSYGDFRSDLETPIVKNGDEAARERLHRMVSPFILRRTKKEVLTDLPDKLEEVRYAGLEKGGEQQRLYDASVVRMKKELRSKTEEEFSRSRIQILAELTRIRQICCDPELLVENYRGGSAKREACLDLLRSAVEGEHKVLLFSQFTSMLELLEKDLANENISFYKITGSTPKEERARLVKAFNADQTPVFLISLKAGGTGLNLTGADVVIHYDPWWNVAAQNQATDRAHRIGQTKVVTVYRLILKDTIEDRILELQEQKRALAEDLLSSEAVGSTRISRDELLSLLS